MSISRDHRYIFTFTGTHTQTLSCLNQKFKCHINRYHFLPLWLSLSTNVGSCFVCSPKLPPLPPLQPPLHHFSQKRFTSFCSIWEEHVIFICITTPIKCRLLFLLFLLPYLNYPAPFIGYFGQTRLQLPATVTHHSTATGCMLCTCTRQMVVAIAAFQIACGSKAVAAVKTKGDGISTARQCWVLLHILSLLLLLMMNLPARKVFRQWATFGNVICTVPHSHTCAAQIWFSEREHGRYLPGRLANHHDHHHHHHLLRHYHPRVALPIDWLILSVGHRKHTTAGTRSVCDRLFPFSD